MTEDTAEVNHLRWLQSNPKVVAIDDEEGELNSLCDALHELGIETHGVHTPDGDHFPERLLGVRVLFLDFVLTESGFKADQCAGNIMRLLGPTATSGPVTIVAWTKHHDRVEDVAKELTKYNSKKPIHERVLPTSIIPLPKAKCQDSNGFNAEKIRQNLSDLLANLESLKFMHEWEQQCHRAAARTTGLIAAHCAPPAGDGFNDEKQWATIHLLAKASAGREFGPEDRWNEAFWRAVNEPLSLVLSDSIAHPEHETASLNGGNPGHANIDDLQIILSDILKKELPSATDAPGSIYKAAEIETPLVPTTSPNSKTNHAKFYRGFVSKCWKKDFYSGNKKDILNSVEAFLIEVTPACDYAQNKKSIHRLIAALFVPRELVDNLGNALYLKTIQNFIAEDGREGTLILNCLYYFTLPIKTELPGPVFRLRSHVVSDILAWYTSHAGRPGILDI